MSITPSNVMSDIRALTYVLALNHFSENIWIAQETHSKSYISHISNFIDLSLYAHRFWVSKPLYCALRSALPLIAIWNQILTIDPIRDLTLEIMSHDCISLKLNGRLLLLPYVDAVEY